MQRWPAVGVTLSCRINQASSFWRDCKSAALRRNHPPRLANGLTNAAWFSSLASSWPPSRPGSCSRRWRPACQPVRSTKPARAMLRSGRRRMVTRISSRQRAGMSRDRTMPRVPGPRTRRRRRPLLRHEECILCLLQLVLGVMELKVVKILCQSNCLSTVPSHLLFVGKQRARYVVCRPHFDTAHNTRSTFALEVMMMHLWSCLC